MDIKIPPFGESITEVTISQWFKKPGDQVAMDEIIAELESDKATFELPAEEAGIIGDLVEEGSTVEIGAVICTIDPSTAVASTSDTPAKDSNKNTTSGVATSSAEEPMKTGEVHEMKITPVGESISEVTLSSWVKNDGDYVAMDEIIAELDSDKASFELPAEKAGILKIVAQEGETLEIGALVCKIEVMTGAPASTGGGASKSSVPVVESAGKKSDSYAAGHPSPAASKILTEKGIDPKTITGTGVDGRITKEDAEKAKKVAKPVASTNENAPASPTMGVRSTERKKMSSLRKTIAKRLVSVKNETAMLTTFNEVNMQPIMDIRKKYKEQFKEKYGVGLGFMSFFTKAVTMAIRDWPSINAQIDGNEIVYHDYVDVSIAVSSPRGLVVPVIRNAEDLDFRGIESEVVRLAKKARDNKLSIEEMQGGTFTITNGGIFGSMLSTPIINAPQSAILGMHNIVQRPVAEKGEVVIRPIMYLALSYDHRIVDGRESVSFLYQVKEYLEDPERILIGL